MVHPREGRDSAWCIHASPEGSAEYVIVRTAVCFAGLARLRSGRPTPVRRVRRRRRFGARRSKHLVGGFRGGHMIGLGRLAGAQGFFLAGQGFDGVVGFRRPDGSTPGGWYPWCASSRANS